MLKSHGRYDYLPIVGRQPYAWPNGARLAIVTAVNIEAFPFAEGMAVEVAAPQPQPDVTNNSWRDWGNRVGFWRILELLEEFRAPGSMLMNTALYEECPAIVEAIVKRGDEIVAHGRTNAERQGTMPEAEERQLIAEVTATIRRHQGKPPTGWMSPWVSNSHVTPDLLHEAGYAYFMDWTADEQPIWFRTRNGRILGVPYPRPTADLFVMVRQQLPPRVFAEVLIDQIDEMLRQAQDAPLVFCVSLHPYLSGHAFRIPHLRRVYRHLAALGDKVWLAHAGAVAAHVIGLPPGIVPGSAAKGDAR